MKFLAIFLSIALSFSVAADNREFGLGQPQAVNDLPTSQLKLDLTNLPTKARVNALRNLQSVSFPINDIEYIRVTPEGELLYVDPAPELLGEPEIALPYFDLTLESTFELHSKLNATNTIYLDFDGEDLSVGRYWNYIHSSKWVPVMIAQPYDVLNNGPEFSHRELEYIYTIWQRVSEDYAPFDVDITTERPESLLGKGHVLITKSLYIGEDGLEHCMYACGAGGVAWLNRWADPFFQPALVYYDNLRTTSYIAEISSHENGHNIGLTHDGIIDGTSYYRGHGEGLIGWAPIMGTSYYKNVTTWSKGEYPDANNTQDDLALISEKIGYATDDYPDSIEEAVALPTKGFIHNESDVDWFFFDVNEEGWLELDVTPSWYNLDFTLHLDDRRGSNLDVEVALIDSEGTVTLFNNPEDTQTQLRQNIDVGRYYIQVTATDSINYSKYNSMGEYIITGGVLAGNQKPIAVSQKICPTNSYNSSNLNLVYTFRKNKSFIVQIDGSESYDTDDGVIIGYTWKDSSGTIISTDIIAEIQLKGTGIREYTLFVTDNEGLDSEDITQIIDVQAAPKGRASKRYKANQVDCS